VLPNPGIHCSREVTLTSLIDLPIALFGVLLTALLDIVETRYLLAIQTSVNEKEHLHEEDVGARDGISVLLSLPLAFTLAMVLTRYDSRKQFIVDEANAIESAMLRTQMLAEPSRSKLHALLQRYLATRVSFTEAGLNEEKLALSENL
jgi:hypothetical protein